MDTIIPTKYIDEQRMEYCKSQVQIKTRRNRNREYVEYYRAHYPDGSHQDFGSHRAALISVVMFWEELYRCREANDLIGFKKLFIKCAHLVNDLNSPDGRSKRQRGTKST